MSQTHLLFPKVFHTSYSSQLDQTALGSQRAKVFSEEVYSCGKSFIGVGKQTQKSKHSPLDYNRLVNTNVVMFLQNSFCRGNCYVKCILLFYFDHIFPSYMLFSFLVCFTYKSCLKLLYNNIERHQSFRKMWKRGVTISHY